MIGSFAFVLVVAAGLLSLIVPPIKAAFWRGDWETLGLFAIGALVLLIVGALHAGAEALLGFLFRPVLRLLRRSRLVVNVATAITAVIGAVLLVYVVSSVFTIAAGQPMPL